MSGHDRIQGISSEDEDIRFEFVYMVIIILSGYDIELSGYGSK